MESDEVVDARGVLGFVRLSRGSRRWRHGELLVVGVLAAVALVRLGLAARTTSLPLPTDSWSARVSGPAVEAVARAVGGPFALTLLAAGVLLASLVALAHRLRIPPTAAATAAALLAVYDPAIVALADPSPGLLGAASVALATALLAHPPRVTAWPAAVAVLAAIVVGPLLVVPAAAAIAGTTGRRWVASALVALALGGSVLALLLVTAAPLPPGAPLSFGLVAAAAVAALAGAARAATRPLAAAVAVLLALPAVTGMAVVVVPPALVGAVVALVGLQVAMLTAWAADCPRRRSAVRVACLVGVVAGAVSVVVPRVLPPATSGPTATQALATWIATTADPAVTLTVPPEVRSRLVAAGVAEDRLVDRGQLVVRVGRSSDGTGLARFGSAADSLTVDATDPATAASAVEAQEPERAALGEQLARNPRLEAAPEVQSMIRDGLLDPRAMAVLATLSVTQPVTVLDLPPVAGDTASQPRRQVAVARLDATTTTFLQTQRSPFRPEVSVHPDRTVLTWTFPASPA